MSYKKVESETETDIGGEETNYEDIEGESSIPDNKLLRASGVYEDVICIN